MEASSSSIRHLIQQAYGIIDQYALSHIENLGVTEIQQELEEVDAKITETRTKRFKDVEETQFAALTHVLGTLDTYCVTRLNSNASGIPELRECYKTIHKQCRIDLEAIREIFSSRVSIGATKIPSRTAPGQQKVDYPDYEKAFKNLKEHLSTLANPILALELMGCFEKITQRTVSGREGILRNFTKLPGDTKQLVEEFDKQLKRLCRTDSQAQMETILVRINDDLAVLSKCSPSKTDLWPKLRELLSLEEIKALENNTIKEILRRIKEGQPARLRNYIQDQLKQSHIDLAELNKTLENRGLRSLDTLIASTIKGQVLVTNGIITNWNRPLDFFQEKTLIFGATTSLGNPSGHILKCRRDSDGCLQFTLDTDFGITVTPCNSEYEIEITKRRDYRLLGLILRNDKDPFELMPSGDTKQQLTISSGTYTLSFSKSGKLDRYLKGADDFFTTLTNTTTRQVYSIFHNTDHHGAEFFRIRTKDENGKTLEKTMTREAFERTYHAKRDVLSDLFKIDKTKCEKLIVIKATRNEVRTKTAQRNNINAAIDKARHFLLAPENEGLLSQLADDLIANRLEKVNVDLKTLPDDITGPLEEVSKQSSEHFNSVQPPHATLKQVILEAIYERLEIKADGLNVANTMELLQKAYTSAEALKGRDGVFFLGETGSGKSASIAYLLGAILEGSNNEAGDQNYRIVPQSNGERRVYPTIGDSLGLSRTLYAQGFELADDETNTRDVMLVDCAGFNDTRGPEWELCANLSIDEAVRNVNRVRSIVVVCPHSAFIDDRANPIMDLIWTVQQRFKGTFKPGTIESRHVHLLVTKTPEIGPSAQEKLRTRIGEHIAEIESHLQEHESSKRRGIEPQTSKQSSLEYKKQIWLALREMQTNDQIHLIYPLDQDERLELVAKICGTVGSEIKQSYVRAMDTPEMRRVFGNLVEQSTETWLHLLHQYLNKIPTSISKIHDEINQKNKRLEQLDEEKTQRCQQIEQYRQQIAISTSFISDLEKAQEGDMTPQVYKKLTVKRRDNAEKELLRLDNELTNLKTNARNTKEPLVLANRRVKELTVKLEKAKTEIDELRGHLAEMSNGDQEVPLHELFYSPDQMISVFKLKEDVNAKDAFEELRDYRDGEGGEIGFRRQLKASEIEGNLNHMFIIDREYRLVPSDPQMLDQFKRGFKTVDGADIYEAKVEGERFKFRFGLNHASSGRKIAYSFTTHWQRGSPLPWIRITHRIPKKEFYTATITNELAEIERLQEETLEAQKELGDAERRTGRQQELMALENEMNKILERCKKLRHSKTQLTKKIETEEIRISIGIQALLKNERELLQIALEQKAALEQSREIEEKIARTDQELQDLQKSLKGKLRTKCYLAVTLKTNLDTTHLIRQLSELALSSSQTRQSKGERGSGLSNMCKAFIGIYDENRKNLLRLCNQDLELMVPAKSEKASCDKEEVSQREL